MSSSHQHVADMGSLSLIGGATLPLTEMDVLARAGHWEDQFPLLKRWFSTSTSVELEGTLHTSTPLDHRLSILGRTPWHRGHPASPGRWGAPALGTGDTNTPREGHRYW